MKSTIITASTGYTTNLNEQKIAQFLYQHLDEYGDTLPDITACLQYVMNPEKGGFIIVGEDAENICGVVVVNHTGMSGYIPENILVYIAVDGLQRGKGIGKMLMEAAIAQAQGGIALHVEPTNPARKLYERLGFSSKYLEMRKAK